MQTSLKSLFALLFVGLCFINTYEANAVKTRRVASGLARPVFVNSPPGDYNRLFIVEQYTAQVKILNLNTNTLNATPFLDINPLVIGSGNERGLLGMAFHPNYAANGYFYLYYINNSGNSVVARYRVSSNPDTARTDSALILLTITQPLGQDNHKGGMLTFSPIDGYLYIGMGDGGSANDPAERAQSDTTLLGKMLRIDVDSGSPYAIPATNPYAAPGNPRDEIFMKGLRNPWRYSFDRLTGNLYIADVGQDAWEEIDVHYADSLGGQNYGWDCTEGRHCIGGDVGCTCPNPAHTLPVYEYGHVSGNCSITGGYVYRGCAIPELTGTYFFADVCSNQIWSFRLLNNDTSEFRNRTVQFAPGGGLSITSISAFGEDGTGELYICDLGGEVFKVIPDTMIDCNNNNRPDSCDIALGISPDVNHNLIPDGCECIPLAPTDLVCALIGENLQLTWTATGTGLETYRVYRSNNDDPFPSGGWSVIASELPYVAGANAMSFTDNSIVPVAGRNFYIVTSVCPN